MPRELRAPVLTAVPVLFAVWALAGLYGALGPALVHALTGSGDVVLGGLSFFVLAASAVVAVIALRRAAARTVMLFGILALIAGVGVTVVAVSLGSVGFPIAEQYFGFDGHPTGLNLRSVPSQVTAVAAVLPATVDPANPSVVGVSYPADILEAALVTKRAYNGLFLGLGALALLVGGVGIANVMVISVLERRSEIGLRRAPGATRRHVAEQFLAEALLLSVLGGVAGTAAGAAATVIYAVSQGWSVQIPAVAFYGGLGAALVIGAIAGLYPSMRAARLSPTEALRTA